jgi:hypothetical protein
MVLYIGVALSQKLIEIRLPYTLLYIGVALSQKLVQIRLLYTLFTFRKSTKVPRPHLVALLKPLWKRLHGFAYQTR